MADSLAKSKIRVDIRDLKGKRTGYSYADLERILLRHGFTVVGKATSHRTFRHPLVSRLCTLKDDGKRDVKTVYIKKARQALVELEARL